MELGANLSTEVLQLEHEVKLAKELRDQDVPPNAQLPSLPVTAPLEKASVCSADYRTAKSLDSIMAAPDTGSAHRRGVD